MTRTWRETARNLRIGSKRKVACCSADKSAFISNGDRGVSFYCFRCGHKDFEPHGERSIAEIMATRRALDELATPKTPTMPDRAVPLTDAPYEAILWVLKGGLTPEDATDKHGMRWDEKTQRVLIPVPGGLLGRAVRGERPKYRLLTNAPGALYWASRAALSAVVVVEDILSAIAVSRAGWAAVAVLGTSLSETQAAEIAAHPSRSVIGWFDGDKAGDQAWARLRKRMALHPVELRRIRTDRDPKNIHRESLKQLLKEQTV